MAVADDSIKRPRGRPRDPEADGRILSATLNRLAFDGYARMSLDDVAADAKVTKPTIYRRFPSKHEVVASALRSLNVEKELPDTGNARDDLVEALGDLREALSSPGAMGLLGAVLVEEHHTPQLLHLWRDNLAGPHAERIRATLELARKQSRLNPDIDTDAITSMLVGAMLGRYISDGSMPASWPTRVVDAIWTSLRAQ